MTTHLLWGRLGPNDAVVPPPATAQNTYELQLLNGNRLNFQLDRFLSDARQLGVVPTEAGFDLLLLALHIYAADTRILRRKADDAWTREITISVPVSDPPLWETANDLLCRMLNFQTGDRWTFQFRPRPTDRAQLSVSLPQPTNHGFTGISLLSGGLDSLIGAIDQLQAGAHPLFVSHFGDSRTAGSQLRLLASLGAAFGERATASVRTGIRLPSDLMSGLENSTRARSFLFLGLGAALGTGLGQPFVLHVPENGFISINIPLDPNRLGSLSTRSTHPYYLARWNELLPAVGAAGEVVNPYWSKSKGQMAAACTNPDLLAETTPQSLSCSSPGRTGLRGGIEHCGYCLPCIIRRAALLTAFSDGDPTEYYLDPAPEDPRKAAGQTVRSVLYALSRLRGNGPAIEAAMRRPGPLTDLTAGEIQQLAQMIGTSLDEIGDFLDDILNDD